MSETRAQLKRACGNEHEDWFEVGTWGTALKVGPGDHPANDRKTMDRYYFTPTGAERGVLVPRCDLRIPK